MKPSERAAYLKSKGWLKVETAAGTRWIDTASKKVPKPNLTETAAVMAQRERDAIENATGKKTT
jgi:hypothetical protein